MDYRTLGQSGLRVSPLCLGTMMFGGATEEPTAARIAARARDQGVNFIDTADGYNSGRSEEIVGRAIREHRSWWVLATKCANPTGEGPNARGVSRRHVFDAVEASLRRLGVDTIDVLYLHKEDHRTPLSETVHALADLIRAGKIRYFGVSNYRSWRVGEICRLCDLAGIDRPIASQPLYNMLNREVEVEHLPACGYFGLGVVPYSPLARGVLTGKYAADAAPPAESRAGRRDRRMMESEWRPESLNAAQEIARHAQRRGMSAAHLAFAWVLRNRFVTAAIGGPRTLEQWDDYVAALECRLDAEDEALVDRLVSPGHPSTPGYNDPQYPIEGRPVR
ncbi:MAG TPA: aldo/keto reductase [Acetobacteraceae bacterium]|nr:aldo/keto reductase [Acetobacteraceae bacterium]